jgi:hypothetical protein
MRSKPLEQPPGRSLLGLSPRSEPKPCRSTSRAAVCRPRPVWSSAQTPLSNAASRETSLRCGRPLALQDASPFPCTPCAHSACGPLPQAMQRPTRRIPCATIPSSPGSWSASQPPAPPGPHTRRWRALHTRGSRPGLSRLARGFLEPWSASSARPPQRRGLDFDDPEDPVQGAPEQARYEASSGSAGFLPLPLEEGLAGRLLTPSCKAKRGTGAQRLAVLKRWSTRLRPAWPDPLLRWRGIGPGPIPR